MERECGDCQFFELQLCVKRNKLQTLGKDVSHLVYNNLINKITKDINGKKSKITNGLIFSILLPPPNFTKYKFFGIYYSSNDKSIVIMSKSNNIIRKYDSRSLSALSFSKLEKYLNKFCPFPVSYSNIVHSTKEMHNILLNKMIQAYILIET